MNICKDHMHERKTYLGFATILNECIGNFKSKEAKGTFWGDSDNGNNNDDDDDKSSPQDVSI